MTDRFRWHPDARLYEAGQQVVAQGAGGPVAADSAEGLAQVIGLPAFRLGALEEALPEAGPVPVFETLTSGSTGKPRRIRRTQGSWVASFAVSAGFGIGPGARVAVLGRLAQSLALYGAVEGLHLGACVHLLGSLRPDRQRNALADQKISHLYATPAQLRLLVDAKGDCPNLRLVLVGGSKLDPALRAALRAMAPAAEIREFYGAAEASFITIADADTPEGSVGRAYPGVAIRVDDDGSIWVQSAYLFEGYAADATASTADERAPSGHTRWRDGWLSVGEIGRLEDGFLYLRGRAGRMVTVADQNVFPEEIEAYMETLPGIRRAAVLPLRDARRGHVLVAMVQGDQAAEAAVMADLRARLGPLKAPKALIWIGEWPVLPSGKTDLRALEAQVSWPV
jgi:long-chain acyl-CoA synthetase